MIFKFHGLNRAPSEVNRDLYLLKGPHFTDIEVKQDHLPANLGRKGKHLEGKESPKIL